MWPQPELPSPIEQQTRHGSLREGQAPAVPGPCPSGAVGDQDGDLSGMREVSPGSSASRRLLEARQANLPDLRIQRLKSGIQVGSGADTPDKARHRDAFRRRRSAARPSLRAGCAAVDPDLIRHRVEDR
jgi:hypothetical protein